MGTGLSDMLGAPPPPAYETVAKYDGRGAMPGGLDASLWLTILLWLVHPSGGGQKGKERAAEGFADLHRHVRFACKDLYMLSMHVCRSRYVDRYAGRVRRPFTSDPYPTGQAVPPLEFTSPPRSNAHGSQDARTSVHRSGEGAGRETRILDLFVAACVRSDMEEVESSLLESTLGDDEEGENDLFAYHQPKARTEDLVIAQGCRAGLLHSDAYQSAAAAAKSRDEKQPLSGRSGVATAPNALKAEDMAIEMTNRSASLRVRSGPGRALRTVFEVQRVRNETLEATAQRILRQLHIHVHHPRQR